MAEEKEVQVHKSTITLLEGESIDSFKMALRDSADTAVRKSIAISKDGWVYLLEVFGDMVVVEVATASTTGGNKYKTYGLPYTRNKDGGFTFGKLSEVRRVTNYLPAPAAGVIDTTKGVESDEAIVAKARAGWAPFWSGVL